VSHFVIERNYKGYPIIETLTGVEDIDTSQYPDITTLWVCETAEEVLAVENELRRKHARYREQT
jgi:hypothetical protein